MRLPFTAFALAAAALAFAPARSAAQDVYAFTYSCPQGRKSEFPTAEKAQAFAARLRRGLDLTAEECRVAGTAVEYRLTTPRTRRLSVAGPAQVNAVVRQLEQWGFKVRATAEAGVPGGTFVGTPALVLPPTDASPPAGGDYVVAYSCPEPQKRSFTQLQSTYAERLKKDLIQVLGLPDSEVKLERLADRSWRVTYQTSQTRTVRAATLDEANQAQRELRKLGFTAEVTRDAGRP